MKKLIAIKPFNGDAFAKDKLFSYDNGTNFFYKFDKKLPGYLLKTIDMVRPGEDVWAYIYLDVPYPWDVKLWKDLVTHQEKNILYWFESPIVNPFNRHDLFGKYFRRIYSWDDSYVNGKKIRKLFIPQRPIDKKLSQVSFGDKKLAVMVNTNRNKQSILLGLLSPSYPNLYLERYRLAKHLSQRNIEFDLYGMGWEKLAANKGSIGPGSKIATISRYKFCVCFENTVAPGYITEKIFDSFKAGAVPIYWGAPNISDYIPKECFIDFNEYANYDELIYKLRSMGKEEYNKYIFAIEKFLRSREYLEWGEELFIREFKEAIDSA